MVGLLLSKQPNNWWTKGATGSSSSMMTTRSNHPVCWHFTWAPLSINESKLRQSAYVGPDSTVVVPAYSE